MRMGDVADIVYPRDASIIRGLQAVTSLRPGMATEDRAHERGQCSLRPVNMSAIDLQGDRRFFAEASRVVA